MGAEVIADNSNKRSRADDSSDEKKCARLSEYYLCSSPPESPGLTEAEAKDQSQTIRSAKLALQYYNSKHNTHYELKEPLLSNGSLWRGGLWIHANFRASESSKKSHKSTTLFFAELTVAGFKSGVAKYSVTACRPLNGSEKTPCEMCDGEIVHPTGRFRQGLYETKPRDLRPRRNGRAI
ncbi:uncharacterized protein LOC141612393 [Silene latifolia]|uniref:uncharacterized protein LOC141612393 n=1 Tax=Silene latifolia TaxID=37657 RepID=UPI003D77CFB8